MGRSIPGLACVGVCLFLLVTMSTPLAMSVHGEPPHIGEDKPVCLPHPPIQIVEDEGVQGFAVAKTPVTGDPIIRAGSGIVAGDGTSENPYIIEGWCIQPIQGTVAAITLVNTSAHVIIENNIINPGEEAGLDHGIVLQDASNVTIRSLALEGFPKEGMILSGGGENVIEGNTISRNKGPGVSLNATSNNTLVQNDVLDNGSGGILVEGGQGNAFIGNTIRWNLVFDLAFLASHDNKVNDNTLGPLGWILEGTTVEDYRHQVGAGNLVQGDDMLREGEPLVYVQGETNRVIDQATGQLLVVDSTNITLHGQHVKGTGIGALVAFSEAVTVEESVFAGTMHAGTLVKASTGTTIQESAFYGNDIAVWIAEATDSRIETNTLRANTLGAYMEEDHGTVIENNTIETNDFGIAAFNTTEVHVNANHLHQNAVHGIYATESQDVSVTENTLTDNGPHGAFFQESKDIQVEDNHIQDHGSAGVFLLDATNATVLGNTLQHNGLFGVSAMRSDLLTVAQNKATQHALYGIAIETTSRVHVEANHAHTNGEGGIRVLHSPGAHLQDNTLHNQPRGLTIEASPNAHIHENQIHDHTTNGIILGSSSQSHLANNTVQRNPIAITINMRSDNVDLRFNHVTKNDVGVLIDGLSWASLHANNLEENTKAALKTGHLSPFDTPLQATENWWGHETGPKGGIHDACTNQVANGNGDAIQADNANVCFDPWTHQPNPHAGTDNGPP